MKSADEASAQNHVPVELLEGAEVVNELPDDVVSYDVLVAEDSFIYKLRRLRGDSET